MSADWIKMRGNLWDDPRVGRLCDLTETSEASIIGGLYWLWASADQHTQDGAMPGLSLRQIDRKTGIKGFGQALCDIGWLKDEAGGVIIIKFEEHNGASAKRRSVEAQRKANVRKVSALDADKSQTNNGQSPDGEQTESGNTADEMRRLAELEKEKEKEEKAKEAAAPPAERIFGSGLQFLIRSGVKESNARSFLGKAKSEMKNDLALLELLEKAERTGVLEPISWLRKSVDAWAKGPPPVELPGEYLGANQTGRTFQ